ncbi:RNA polymerase sigma factor [Intestinimonas butyriciproducens]|uniref:RNA polymerase sigma factor n=1 Tax=Intestinimonas butyriciproducens TaxID=1297617 RepID=UPI00051B4F12|nr:sigma-70 family RNA polymerase sigma factor [Intestinimonas butyriciproducens]
MTVINLRDIYPHYAEDTFVEVSDEVFAVFAEDKRLQRNYAQYLRYHKAYYSLDCNDGIETAALHKPEQPDELLMQAEEKQKLERALASLSEVQRRRIIAYFIDKKRKVAIANAEGVDEGAVRKSITRGLTKMKDFLENLDKPAASQ